MCSGASRKKSELIRVLPGVHSPEGAKHHLAELVHGEEVFFVQFPLSYAIKQQCVTFVGKYPVPDAVKLPQYYRTKHVIRGEFISWHIVDAETLKIRAVKEFSDEERHLSPAGIWNDTLLAERIAAGWKPEDWV